MAITGAERIAMQAMSSSGVTPSSDLPAVRRLEAVGFRAWPAETVVYDGSWQWRLTPGHPSKRLNALVPLDPSDIRDMEARLERAGAHFAAAGKPLTVRETPLAPPALIERLSARGWRRFDSTAVMTVDLVGLTLPDLLDHIPSHDIARFVEASHAVEGGADHRAALARVIGAIQPPSGLFVIEAIGDGPVATAIAVQDNDLAGICGLAVRADRRREGLGAEILASALRWARMRGARSAWLQCGTGNTAALALYERFGFSPLYHYHYWQEPQA